MHSLRNDGDGLQTGPSKQKQMIVFDVELMPFSQLSLKNLRCSRCKSRSERRRKIHSN